MSRTFWISQEREGEHCKSGAERSQQEVSKTSDNWTSAIQTAMSWGLSFTGLGVSSNT